MTTIDLDAVPEGWAVRTEDGKTEYVLCLFAPTADDAERMSREEAQRHVVAFAEALAAWMHRDWRTSSEAHDEYRKYRDGLERKGIGADIDGVGLHFEDWAAQQIVAMAKRERALPESFR